MKFHRFCTYILCALAFAQDARTQNVAVTPLPNRPHIWQREGILRDSAVLIRGYQHADSKLIVVVAYDILTGEAVKALTTPILRDPKSVDAFVNKYFGGIDPAPQSVKNRSALAQTPKWIYMPSTGGNNSIEIFDPETFQGVTSINVEPHLFGGTVFSSEGSRLYATLWRSTTTTPPVPARILVVDTERNQVLNRITLTGDMLPSAPVVSKDDKLLFFADPAQGLIVVDLDAGAILDRIPASRAGAATNQFTTLSMSPDGALICLTDSAGIALLDTRTRTFIARINMTLPNRSIAPVFDPTGSLIYVIDRRTVSGAPDISLVSYDTSELLERSRTTLPSTLDPYHLAMTPDGLTLAMDGFLRVANQPAKGVLIMVDTTTNRVVLTNDSIPSSVGALGMMVR